MTDDRGRMFQKKGDQGHLPTAEPEFPTLTAIRDFDRQQHIQKSIEAGLSREEAERHADEHDREWSPRHVAATGRGVEEPER